MTLHDTGKTTPLAGPDNVNLAANFNKWRVKLLTNFVLTSFRLNARLTTRDSLTLTLKRHLQSTIAFAFLRPKKLNLTGPNFEHRNWLNIPVVVIDLGHADLSRENRSMHLYPRIRERSP
jgi:hypothetical protein